MNSADDSRVAASGRLRNDAAKTTTDNILIGLSNNHAANVRSPIPIFIYFDGHVRMSAADTLTSWRFSILRYCWWRHDDESMHTNGVQAAFRKYDKGRDVAYAGTAGNVYATAARSGNASGRR